MGLGYKAVKTARRRLDIDGGVKLGFPMNPFVRARYRSNVFVSDTTLLRFRETVFWRRDRRLGATSQVDLEEILSGRHLLRWRTLATVSQTSQGVDWLTGLTLYQGLGGSRAIAYQVEVDGETDRDVPLEDTALRVIYRQSVAREWLFLEVRGSLRWPREELDEDREPSLGIAFGVEILFGDLP